MNYYQGQQMQAPNLPVSATQLVGAPVAVNVGQPPFIPMINAAPQMQQYIPLIMSVIVMEIQNKMQQNPLRIFMFNWYSRNGYNNAEMTELLEICTNYIYISLMCGQESDPTQATFNHVPNLVTMMAGAQIKPFQPLLQLLTPEQQQAAVNGARALEQVVRDIMSRMGNQIQQPQQFQQQFQQPTQQFGNFGNFGGQPQLVQRGPHGVTMAAASSGSSGLFSQPQYQQPTAPQQVGGVGGIAAGGSNRYSQQLQEQLSRQQKEQQVYQAMPQQGAAPAFNNTSPTTSHRTVADLLGIQENTAAVEQIKQPFQPRHAAEIAEFSAEPAQPVQVMTQQPQQFFGEVATSSQTTQAPQAAIDNNVDVVGFYTEENLPPQVTWTRSAKQPYHPAWNPRKQKLAYAVTNDGAVLAVLTNVSESEIDMMEYEKHVIGTVPADVVVEQAAAEQPIVDRVLKPEDVKVEFVKKATMFDTERSAYLHTRMQSRLGNKLDDVDAYTIPAVAATPLICDTIATANEYREILTKISTSGSFSAVCKILNDLTGKNQLLLRTYINELFTEEVNSVLTMELGMSGCSIDDFAEDVESLGVILHRAYGEAVSNALRLKEEYIIERCMGTMDEKESNDYTQIMVGDMDGFDAWGGGIAYANSTYTYTYINSYSYELNIAGKKGHALMVTEESNLKLHTIIHKVLEDARKSEDSYRRAYLVTLDGIRFEIARGFINPDALLIRKTACPI